MRTAYLVIFLLILILALYLNRTYAYFFNYISSHQLVHPFNRDYLIEGKDSKAPKVKYVALGDSLTVGTGVPNFKESYPYLVGQFLAQKASGVQVINLAVPGAKIENIYTDVNALRGADFVTILIGINDIRSPTTSKTFEEDLKELEKNLKEQTKARILVLNIPYLGSDKISYFPFTLMWDLKVRQFNMIIKNVSDAEGIEVLDLYKITNNSFKGDNSYYSVDQFHPSSKGYILWSDYINEILSPKSI